MSAERQEKGVVDVNTLPGILANSRLILWQGDITRLRVDAVMDADSSGLLGCLLPCHGCVDNAIHSAAGLRLRDACSRMMEAQGYPEPVGRAKLTPGYQLPAQYVLHTVGPVVHGDVTARNRKDLADCYRSCLALVADHQLRSIAFCCISTGEFHFPKQEAAEIALHMVSNFLRASSSLQKVVFNVFKKRAFQKAACFIRRVTTACGNALSPVMTARMTMRNLSAAW
ncbi:O-acetyl-ADP-ribose deacetylase (regulator of RNase III), contains Macro domain [Oscillibacter sp. PC13]|uniref:macro domain-containing protein n=1 Tax=Oscillibacter sp. PC13 TaxID=1855299 RepID=UPI0008F25181|nr:O-acetyl-ADP-ribose deacetylase (regulator of RNase III), contains Macro domain [Oscillibacter sp. PC13]